MALVIKPSLVGKAYLFIFLLILHKTSDKYFSLIILAHFKCMLLRPVILDLHQKAQKCTYGPNTIKLNAFYYSINLIMNRISMTTKTCIYSYCLLGSTCNDLKELHNREKTVRGRERDGVMNRCGCRWERRSVWPDRSTVNQLVALHLSHLSSSV